MLNLSFAFPEIGAGDGMHIYLHIYIYIGCCPHAWSDNFRWSHYRVWVCCVPVDSCNIMQKQEMGLSIRPCSSYEEEFMFNRENGLHSIIYLLPLAAKWDDIVAYSTWLLIFTSVYAFLVFLKAAGNFVFATHS